MLTVAGNSFNISDITNEYPENSIERQLLNMMSTNTESYKHDSLDALRFELDLRKEVVNAAISLNNSRLSFSVFSQARCNPMYWDRTPQGGFLLKENANASDAVNDIFQNGYAYATECSTAIMIVYCKALINALGEDFFNTHFSKLYLMDWETETVLEYVNIVENASLLLGDGGYFSNPDYNPQTPEWQGENVIVLPNSMYYGHGIGITTDRGIIHALNNERTPSSNQSAYLSKTVNRLNAKKLFSIYHNHSAQPAHLTWSAFPAPIVSL